MNKKVLLGFVIAFLVIGAVAMAGCTGTDNEKTYIIGVDVTYPPYAMVEDGQYTGFDVEAAKWVAEKEGIKVDFMTIDWDALTTYLSGDKCDMIWSGLSVTESRKAHMDFSKAYDEVQMGVASKKGSDVTLEQVMNGEAVIGVQAGCSAEESLQLLFGADKFKQLVDSKKIVNTYPGFTDSMNDLKIGRTQAVVFDDAGIKEQIAQNPNDFVYLGILEGAPEALAVGVKKGNTELLKIINDGITKLMADPYWEELNAKYFPQE
ncbi:MAG TPA: transporter substrate-binding domain-containing protein [Methanocorpusculum sp.]|nr:transporter substrate-binding domain-containing protein [Methanocorpusculum sp.]